MVTDWEYLSRRVRRRSTGIFLRGGISTFASVDLIVPAQEGVEAEMRPSLQEKEHDETRPGVLVG